MRIALGSVGVDERFRRVIACYDGEHGQKASRDRVRQWVLAVGSTLDADAEDEFTQCRECNPTEPK